MKSSVKSSVEHKSGVGSLMLRLMLTVFLISFIMTFFIFWGVKFTGSLQANKASSISIGREVSVERIAPGTAIRTSVLYRQCNHRELADLERSEDWVGRPMQDLLLRFPKEQGWHLEKQPGTIIFSREEMGLCSQDRQKRHMGVSGEYVAIIIGPPGVNGGLDKLTNIRVAQLPEHLRNLAKTGRLELVSEEELAQVLDGYDEVE